MSSHVFRYREFHVQTGWDRPLQHFFLTVETTAQRVAWHGGEDNDDYVYCNLNDPSLPLGGGMSVAQVLGKLDALGIKPPSDLARALHADRRTDVGNHVMDWGEVL